MNHPSFALRRGAVATITILLSFALAACAAGNGEATQPAATSGDGGGTMATVSGGTVEITAQDLEFSATIIEAPAGEPFTVSFTNNDSEPHNWSIYTEEGGEPIAQGNVIGQGETDQVEVEALEAGEYFFVCDVHPNEMTGTVVVG